MSEQNNFERALFEQWVMIVKPQLWPDDRGQKTPSGSYVNEKLQSMWLGWQAALTQSTISQNLDIAVSERDGANKLRDEAIAERDAARALADQGARVAVLKGVTKGDVVLISPSRPMSYEQANFMHVHLGRCASELGIRFVLMPEGFSIDAKDANAVPDPAKTDNKKPLSQQVKEWFGAPPAWATGAILALQLADEHERLRASLSRVPQNRTFDTTGQYGPREKQEEDDE